MFLDLSCICCLDVRPYDANLVAYDADFGGYDADSAASHSDVAAFVIDFDPLVPILFMRRLAAFDAGTTRKMVAGRVPLCGLNKS